MDTNRFEVYGCYGTMSVDVGTGNVLEYEPIRPDEAEYADIARIDIPTYETLFGQQINPGDHVCIMDLSFWSHDGRCFKAGYPEVHPNDGDRDCSQPVIVLSPLSIVVDGGRHT